LASGWPPPPDGTFDRASLQTVAENPLFRLPSPLRSAMFADSSHRARTVPGSLQLPTGNRLLSPSSRAIWSLPTFRCRANIIL